MSTLSYKLGTAKALEDMGLSLKTSAYHGSPTAGISTLEPRLDPRTGKTSLFTSKHPEHAAIHALLADRATANITHQTKGGKFISGHAITKEDLLPHGYLYELPGSGGELSKATKPTSSKKITVADLKNMGWTFEKKAVVRRTIKDARRIAELVATQ